MSSRRNGNGRGSSLIVGVSDYAARVREDCAWAASRYGHVVVTGETGSGKKVVLAELRRLLSKLPYERVGVPQLSADLRHSLLLGHVKGAFTGADSAHTGFVERVAGGILALDDGDKLIRDEDLQTVLLDIAEQAPVYPVGANKSFTPDVRLVVMFQQPLEELVDNGLRRDLAERLDHDRITLKPLREHREDIPALATHMLTCVAERERLEVPIMRDITLSLLERHPWPGNVRQLGNVLRHGLIAAVRDEAAAILPRHLPPPFGAGNGNGDSCGGRRGKRLSEGEVRSALEQAGGNARAASRRLGCSERNVWYWKRKIESQDWESQPAESP